MHACVRVCVVLPFFVACNEKNGVRMGIDRKTDRQTERELKCILTIRRTYIHGEVNMAILVVQLCWFS